MSQRIEKGPRFTPAMGGMAARRRPAAGPSSSQPSKAPPPSSVPAPTSASPGPSQHHDQQQQQQRPAQSKPASGSMAPPPPRTSTTAPTTKKSTSIQPSKVAPSSSPKPIARPSNAPHPAPAPTRSYASSSSSSFAPGASRAAGQSKTPQPDSQPSSSSTTANATQRRPSTSSTSTSAFKPPVLSGSATRPASNKNAVSTSEAVETPSADTSDATSEKPQPATTQRAKKSKSSSFTPRRPSDTSQSQPLLQSRASEEVVPPTQQPHAVPEALAERQSEEQLSSHNDNAIAIDAALAHLRKTSAVQQQSDGSQQHNQFAPRPQQRPPSPLQPAYNSDDGAQTSAASTPGPSRPKNKSTGKRPRKATLPDGHPPKPLSAYFLFLAEHRDLVRQENSDASVSQVAKLCGERWRNLSSKEKSTYEEQAALRKHQYEQELQAWKDKTPNWEELLSRSAAEADSDNEEREGEASKRRKQSSRRRRRGPKRPPSAYLLYAQEQRRAVAGDKAKETFAETNKRIGDSWRVLPLATKEEYLAKSQELKKQYEIDLAKWQEDHPDDGDSDGSETDTQGSGSEPGQKRRKRAGGRPRVVGKSITDEEKEYEALVAEHGETLAPLRLQTSNTNMSDLTTAEYRHGVASKRTFELDRVRQKQLEDAFALRNVERQRLADKRRMIKENLKKSRDGSEVVLPKYDPKTDTSSGRRNAFNVLPGPHSALQSSSKQEEPSALAAEKNSADPDEEVVSGDEDDVEEELGGRPQDKAKQRDHLKVPGLDDSDDDDEEDRSQKKQSSKAGSRKRPTPIFRGEKTDEEEVYSSDAESDAGSMRSGTSVGTHHSLRDNASAPQMRIVNGEIVLDETSLQVNRGGGSGLDDEPNDDDDDVLEEVATHKFVNTATNSKRQKVSRWTLKETDEFFKAVSMWGTDFEMISRMFPNRTRKQIKSKWTKEERGNPTRLNDAFARKVPVNLNDYAIMANVDLSGPPPQVIVNGKTEADLAIFKRDDALDEEDAEDQHRTSSSRVKKASQTPDPFARRGSQGPPSTIDDSRTGGGAGAGGKKSKQSEREQRKLRERARRSGRTYDVEEEIVDEAPPE